jgi:16S rRNA processing protein RimM
LSDEKHRWVAVARILRARGNKGEVAAHLLTDFPERLSQVRNVYLAAAAGGGEPQAYEVSSFWISQNHKGQAVFHFAGVNSIHSAEQLRGRDVLLPIEERVKLPAGMYFVADLVGCTVFEHSDAASVVASSPCSAAIAPSALGTVAEVEFVGQAQAGTPLLRVETSQGELLIPLAEDICFRIDTVAKRIDVRLPDGLRELSEPE